MQSQIASWEQSQVLCPLLASSPPAQEFLQSNYNFLSSTPFGNFNATTPQNAFEPFSTQTASQATNIFDSLLNSGTISSTPNGHPPANSLAQANTNITEYLKNIAALNTNAATTTATNDLTKVLTAALQHQQNQPSTPTTTQLLSSANNVAIGQQNSLIAGGQEAQTRALLENTADPMNNPFAQPSPQNAQTNTTTAVLTALLSAGQSQQQSIAQKTTASSLQPNATTTDQLKSLISSSLLQQKVASVTDSNPFLAPEQQIQGAFKFVGSPQNTTLTETLKMLRSPIRADLVSSAKKPIPLNNPIDLACFRVKDPHKWSCDDVVAWVLDVARRHNIPREEIGVIEFGSRNGMSLTQMTEQNFKEINSSFGSLMFMELRRLLNDNEPISTIDDLIRYCKNGGDQEETSTSHITTGQQINNSVNLLNQSLGPASNNNFGRFLSATSSLGPLSGVGVNLGCNQQSANLSGQLQHSPVANVLQIHHQQQDANLQQLFNSHPHLATGSAVANVFAQQRKQLNDLQQQQQMLQAHQLLQQKNAHHLGMASMPGPSSVYDNSGNSLGSYGNGIVAGENGSLIGGKIRKNKDGRPRKRSQHTKGNKLWEFIRDALKDPATCPTIVRWEDPEQGVFRIVESEKLARLWGEKKNNQKMTYEKLSRAMRTYYEKQILVPVPKTGLYPKKLVYKFGPGAHGWTAPPSLVHACIKLQQHE